ncbi:MULTISPECIES: hypothetical protein [Lelliottia]|uniref:HTH iclR-type domain-containing protein n=1 Tax=Lelliottia aquatilis TaxID=2080838 RepID=A0ABX5A5H9_9ENTR|nr:MULTISPECIES: hypothetical protein [Lelliottia]POZ20643.1 hypothetical protein C3711_22150 [Lelliottia aquatilis]POZ26009.1 hypothetical protein C3712_04615 [Lelliottia aquatilis]POZ29166.1 hypothetical protein C3708_04620 [Lelliottia sp. 7254-16]POZ33471.1 hypothetical protein C3710_08610 [Lelliottia aquatilis]POZ39792.1 hypothetical protein C3709_04615 [Lelliottia aquatilis]
MTQTMTDDVKRIMAAFREAPVMTLQAVTTMTGLSEHTTRFILEQFRQAGLTHETHGHWSLTEAASIIRESALHVFNSER